MSTGFWSILLVCFILYFMTACEKNIAPAKPGSKSPQSADSARENPSGGSAKPAVVITTTMGNMTVELWPDKAPETVRNFLAYVDNGFYDGLVFHRVIKGFMIQGGGFTPELERRPTGGPIENEAKTDVSNLRGTIAMARLDAPDTATSQFFINLEHNTFLDHRDNTPEGFGYCVFGQVIDGMEVADAIANVPTKRVGMNEAVPVEPVVITSIRRVK